MIEYEYKCPKCSKIKGIFVTRPRELDLPVCICGTVMKKSYSVNFNLRNLPGKRGNKYLD